MEATIALTASTEDSIRPSNEYESPLMQGVLISQSRFAVAHHKAERLTPGSFAEAVEMTCQSCINPNHTFAFSHLAGWAQTDELNFSLEQIYMALPENTVVMVIAGPTSLAEFEKKYSERGRADVWTDEMEEELQSQTAVIRRGRVFLSVK